MSMIGMEYNISSLNDNNVPDRSPINDDMITITIDSLKILVKYFIYGTPKSIMVKKKKRTVNKSSRQVIMGFTILLGSFPFLKAMMFNPVEVGIENDKVSNIVIIGIKMIIPNGSKKILNKT